MTRLRVVLGALLVSFGCASIQNTPKQDYVWAMWDHCKASHEIRASTMWIARVDPDGRYWSNVTAGPGEAEWPKIQACMNDQFKAHPYLEWLRARQASAPRSATMPSPGNAASPAAATAIMAPVWRVGDEWEYAFKTPSSSGTYVWSVDRIEVLDGVEHYVIKNGSREIFERVSDLANSLERDAGVVVVRHSPPRLSYAWPLEIGKTWEQTYREERPVDRQTVNHNALWNVELDGSATVPAGTFRTLKIVCRNKNTNALRYEIWYAPAVKQIVKTREVLGNGIRERELLAYKLKSER